MMPISKTYCSLIVCSSTTLLKNSEQYVLQTRQDQTMWSTAWYFLNCFFKKKSRRLFQSVISTLYHHFTKSWSWSWSCSCWFPSRRWTWNVNTFFPGWRWCYTSHVYQFFVSWKTRRRNIKMSWLTRTCGQHWFISTNCPFLWAINSLTLFIPHMYMFFRCTFFRYMNIVCDV